MMPRSNNNRRNEDAILRVPFALKAAFEAAATATEQRPEMVIEDFMRSYVEEHQKPETGHDEWFRSQVQAAVDDPRPGIPHDEMMQKAKALLDTLAADKLDREN
jgi:hypothetical protein